MKRIINARKLSYVIILSILTVFFTGCNGRSGQDDFFEIPVYDASGVKDDVETFPVYDENDIITGGMIEKETVYFEPQMEREDLEQKTEGAHDARFDGVSGPYAFYFPKDHLVNRNTLKRFQVLGLINGTFYYYYVIQPEDGDTEIHAAARYHYGAGVYMPLYERKVKVKGDDAAYTEFYAQLFKKDDGYRICIYDDGNLTLLNNQGKKLFSFTDEANGKNMRDIIRRVFDVGGEYYDVEITDVITDGNYYFSIPVTVIKEDYTEVEDMEADLTTASYIFTYTYLTVNTEIQMIYQNNLNLEKQKKRFEELAKEGGLRDAEKDWETVISEYPDLWGSYYLGTSRGGTIVNEGYIMQWENPADTAYKKDEQGNPSTHPTADFVKPLSSVKPGDALKEVIFIRKNPASICEMYGEVKNRSAVKTTLKRSYTYMETVTKIGEDGKEYKEDVPRKASDSITANQSNKITLAEGAFLNDYAVKVPSMGVDVVKGPVERDGSFQYGFILDNKCLLEGNQGGSSIVFPEAEGGGSCHISLLNTIGGHPYAMASDITNNRIYLNVLRNASAVGDGIVALNTADLAAKYRKGEQDEQLFDTIEEVGKREDTRFDFAGTEMHDNPSIYTKDSVVVMGKPAEESFLFTSFQNGMQLYRPSVSAYYGNKSTPGTAWQISDWPIYQAWPISENKVAAIGFDRTDTVYESMDIAMARVYIFDVNEIKKTAPFHKVPLETAGQE